MVNFIMRETHPTTYKKPFDAIYWNVLDRSYRVGWVGVFSQEKKWYTDIYVKERERGNGYFKQMYDKLIDIYWNKDLNLYAFIGHDNKSSIRAHEKYGCKIFKHNKSTDIYLVHKGRRNDHRDRNK